MNDRVPRVWRHAARRLVRAPGFTIFAGLTIALGIGATSAVFALVHATLLEPLPYPRAGRLVTVHETRNGEPISVAYPNYLDWQARATSVSSLAVYSGASVTLSGVGRVAERVRGVRITANLLSTLGVQPMLGSGFTARDDAEGGPAVVILGHDLWAGRFGSDSTILGRSILIDGVAFQVTGIMPAGFDFPGGIVYGSASLWLPMSGLGAGDRHERDSHPGLYAIGRLRDGVSVDAARREFRQLAASLAREHPETNRDLGAELSPALDDLVGDLVPGLALLAVAVAALLLITTGNVAGLQLARNFARRREIVIHAALGASRAAIVRQLLAESMLVALGGGVVGILLGAWGLRAARPLFDNLPRMGAVGTDWRVVAFTGVAAALSGALFGIGPALAASGRRLDGWLRDRADSVDRAGATARRVLVVAQMALSLALVVSATLLARSFAHLRGERGGVEPNGVLTFQLQLPESTYPWLRTTEFYASLLDEMRGLPGVRAAGATSLLPMGGSGSQSGMQPLDRAVEVRRTDVAVVTPGYFRAMGVALRRGRTFTPADDSGAVPVAVIDESLANAFWPGEDPIGKQVSGWGFHALTVVGVVAHVKNYGIGATSRQELYVPHAQRPFLRMTGVVRFDGAPESLGPALRRLVGARDPSLAVYNLRAMSAVVDGTVAGPRLSTVLGSVFAALSLLLAAVGLFGVLAVVVSQRTREFGVRLALGATPAGIVRAVLRQALGTALAGTGAGIVAALLAVRLVRHQLYGVSALDPVAFASGGLLFLLVALVASAIPAVRAARVSPTEALREH